MERKKAFGIIIVFVIWGIIRKIGIENIPVNTKIYILIVCSIIMIFSMVNYIKGKSDKKEKLYLMLISMITIILYVITVILLTTEDRRIDNMAVILAGILVLSLLVIIICNIIYKKNKAKNN